LILKLSDGETATVSKDKPFQRVDGYSADLKYDPEGPEMAGPPRWRRLKICGGRLQYRCHPPERSDIVRAIKPKKNNLAIRALIVKTPML
jgi:hypothetical protein